MGNIYLFTIFQQLEVKIGSKNLIFFIAYYKKHMKQEKGNTANMLRSIRRKEVFRYFHKIFLHNSYQNFTLKTPLLGELINKNISHHEVMNQQL